MKEELVKVKSDCHLNSLELDKLTASLEESEAARKKLQTKLDSEKAKTSTYMEQVAVLQHKLSVFEHLK